MSTWTIVDLRTCLANNVMLHRVEKNGRHIPTLRSVTYSAAYDSIARSGVQGDTVVEKDTSDQVRVDLPLDEFLKTEREDRRYA